MRQYKEEKERKVGEELENIRIEVNRVKEVKSKLRVLFGQGS